MISTKITNGAEFVVFDMEWNQPIYDKTYDFETSELTGEIIEIGAVKYVYDNGSLIKKGVFSTDVRPKMYKQLHYHVKKVTNKTNKDLKKGVAFEVAYDNFVEFCGKDAILVGWGNSDPHMLKMNLKFFDLDDDLGRYFLDLQPIFSLFAAQMGKQRSVEFAVDYYNIPKTETFHSATADAIYTGAVFEAIFEHNQTAEVLSSISSSSIDPDIQSEFSFVGQDFEKATDCFAPAEGFTSVCPVCGSKLKVKIGKFRIRKSEYALLSCNEHGEMFVRTRAKKNKSGKYYCASVMRFATQNDYFLVASKQEEFRKYGDKGAPLPQPVTEEAAKPEEM